MQKAKKTNSSVPGDIPKQIIDEFAVEIAGPATTIFNTALKNLEYPDSWKKELAIPIGKITNPETKDDLRLISLTRFISKVLESFIAEWIIKFAGP